MAIAAILPTATAAPASARRGWLTYQRLMLVMLVFAGVTLLIVVRLLFLQLFTDRGGPADGQPA